HVLIDDVVRDQHLLDAVEFGSGLRNRPAALASDQHMHVGAERLRCCERLVGRVLDCRIVVLGNEERCHQITPASFLSLSTSSLTVFTFTPDLRPAGSVVLSTSRRGAMSTPLLAGGFSAIGFFFAFMMLGRLA